jgi:hypothetical protein
MAGAEAADMDEQRGDPESQRAIPLRGARRRVGHLIETLGERSVGCPVAGRPSLRNPGERDLLSHPLRSPS